MATVAHKAFYAQLHGLAGVITKPADAVLFLENESGAVVTITAADAPHLVVLGAVEDATAQYVQDMAAGRAAVACSREEGRSLMSTSTFRETVAMVADKAKAKLPQAVNGRIDGAVKLVLSHDVVRLEDGTIEVGSSSDPLKVYTLVGTACTCKDFTDGKAPEGWCRHRIAAGISKRVGEVLAAQSTPVEPEPAPPVPEAPVVLPHGIDPRHIVTIQGKLFVKFAGLLDLAHQRGLQSLKVDWTHNSEDLSLAHAVAVFSFGTFEESGDATAANVAKKVAPHFRRVALTRAAARALRVALGLDMVAAEELADE